MWWYILNVWITTRWRQRVLIQVKSSQVKKFYWHKFIHFYNNHEVTETQLGLFVTTKYMTYLSNEKDFFLTKQVSRVQNKTVPRYWYLRKYEQMK